MNFDFSQKKYIYIFCLLHAFNPLWEKLHQNPVQFFSVIPRGVPLPHINKLQYYIKSEKFKVNDIIFLSGCEAHAINPFPNKPWFSRVCSTSLLKTLCEKENCLWQAILPFHKVFSIHLENILPFQILNCRLQTLSIWSSLKFAVWERVNLGNKNMKIGIFTGATSVS